MSSSTQKHSNSGKFEKCGEIFHLNGAFKIVCTFAHDCEVKKTHFAFRNFFEHFQEEHWNKQDSFNHEISVQTLCLPKCATSEEFPELTYKKEEEYTEEKETDDSKESIDMNGDTNELPLSQIKSYNCGQCEKKFVSGKGLFEHIRRRHENEIAKKSFSCNHCEQNFDERSALRKHKRTSHVLFSCDICPKSYKSNRRLREHLLTHDENSCFPCTYEGCTKTFKTPVLLSTHKNIHSPVRIYLCEICGFQTIRNQTLRQHVLSHTGVKNFPCKICGKYFVSSAMVKEHQASHLTERRFKCDDCGATFTRKKSLYHHKPLHLAIKKFICRICGSHYAQAAGLSSHMRRHKLEGKIQLGFIKTRRKTIKEEKDL